MAATILILEFLFFSFIGWIIDSAYRSLDENKWINAGSFKGPFCPIYGFSGLILLYLFKNLNGLSLWLQIISASVALILVEYVGGVFSEKILKIKLWDYSSSRFHLGGYIDLLHSFFWFWLTIVFYFVIYPLILFLEPLIVVPEFIELPLLLLFVIGGIWLTLRKAPVQYLDIHGRMMDITVQKYNGLHSLIKTMYKNSSLPTQRKLQRLIQQQLKTKFLFSKKAFQKS